VVAATEVESQPGGRATQRDIVDAVNSLESALGGRLDNLSREFREWRETHERRHLDEMRVAIEDHSAIRQLEIGRHKNASDIASLENTVAGHGTVLAELRGMGNMIKLVFGTSVIGAIAGIIALFVIVRDIG